jgi:hypothetical protein
MKALSPAGVGHRCSACLYGLDGCLLPEKNQWKLRARAGPWRHWAIQSEGKVRMVETKLAYTQEAQKDRKGMMVLMR